MRSTKLTSRDIDLNRLALANSPNATTTGALPALWNGASDTLTRSTSASHLEATIDDKRPGPRSTTRPTGGPLCPWTEATTAARITVDNGRNVDALFRALACVEEAQTNVSLHI